MNLFVNKMVVNNMEFKKTNRAFKGVWIPSEIWLNTDLSVMEKVFLTEIDSLDNKEGCFAGNKYFSEFFNISKGRCTQIIKGLEGKGYLNIQLEYKEDTKQILLRRIKVNKTYLENAGRVFRNCTYPCLENDEDNNIPFNNTNKQKIKPPSENGGDQLEIFEEQEQQRKPPCKPPEEIPVEEIIELWNTMMVNQPKIRIAGKTITPKIKSRWGENKDFQSLESWRDLFIFIKESDFLMGRVKSEKPFKLTLDWVCGPENWEKILNGKYTNRDSSSGLTYEQTIANAKARSEQINKSINWDALNAIKEQGTK